MDPKQTLIDVAGHIAKKHVNEAQEALDSYQNWRAKDGFEPTLHIAGHDIPGDKVYEACVETIVTQGDFSDLLSYLHVVCQLTN